MLPDDFIGQAEESGLILPLEKWVLDAACAQLARWSKRLETAGLGIAVKVSARQFRHPDFVEQLLSIVETHGVDARQLKHELTESLLATGMEITVAKMGLLKCAGMTLSIDDFGMGCSALSYLKHLPLDQLKIEHSFVRDIFLIPTMAPLRARSLGLLKALVCRWLPRA